MDIKRLKLYINRIFFFIFRRKLSIKNRKKREKERNIMLNSKWENKNEENRGKNIVKVRKNGKKGTKRKPND